jgi:hypothetical protein
MSLPVMVTNKVLKALNSYPHKWGDLNDFLDLFVRRSVFYRIVIEKLRVCPIHPNFCNQLLNRPYAFQIRSSPAFRDPRTFIALCSYQLCEEKLCNVAVGAGT